MFARIRFVCLALCAIAGCCTLATPAAAQCPAKSTVTDTLFNADGSHASGRVTIAWPTFLIGSCQVISGQSTVTVVNGAFTVQLYPNTSAVPAGTSYRVTFALKSGRITTEYWVVPASVASVALATVRAPSVPVPAVLFGESQVTNLVADLAKKLELPSPCPPGKAIESNGSSTPPQVNCVDPSGGSGSQHQVNGANLASNNPVNFQSTPSITFTNPGAGDLQAAIADGAVTAAKLAVSNPSAAQLAGIGDSNIAGAALSPNRVVGTAVTQSRAINTTSPITGGGDLSADRTIACAACVISVSGTPNEISSTGGVTPMLSLPAFVDLSGKTLKGSAPLVLDGATADANKTTVVVTDPTAARNFTLPNADSVAVQQATCSGTDKVSAINSLGVITCSTDQAGGGGAHNLLSATHTDTVAASPALGDLLYGNATPAWTKLAGNTTATKKYLSQTGMGAVSAAPAWSQPGLADLSDAATVATRASVQNAAYVCADTSVGTDSYAITVSPAPDTYALYQTFCFKADVANSGAATLAVNGQAAKTIKKIGGGVTTDLADNDIRASQVVYVAFDGTNFQMLGQLGNAASGSGTTMTVNGSALAGTTADFDDATPAVPSTDPGSIPVSWQKDSASPTTNVSGRISNVTSRYNVRRTGALIAVGSSNIFSAVGDQIAGTTGTASSVAPTSTEPATANYATAATTNAEGGAQGQLNYRTGRNHVFQSFVKMTEATVVRTWVGLSDQSAATMRASATPAGNYAAFRFDTGAGDTNWMACVRDNVTTNCQSTGIAGNTTARKLQIVENGSTSWLFYIGGSLVYTHTCASSNCPVAGTNMRMVWGTTTLENVAKNLKLGWLTCEGDL